MSRAITLLVLLTLVLGSLLQPSATSALAEPAEVNEAPTTLIASGVSSYTMAAPKVYWHTGVPECPPASPQPLETYYEKIRRVATYGSDPRVLYSVLENCAEGKILSNIVADDNYLYWLGPAGLMRLSTSANTGDSPGLINNKLQAPGELAMDDDRVYAIYTWLGDKYLGYVLKLNKELTKLTSVASNAKNLKMDGKYAYFYADSTLYRLNPGVDIGQAITTFVSDYYPEGKHLLFCNPTCYYSDYVFVVKGRSIYHYNNDNDTLDSTPIYTSVDSTASISSPVTGAGHLSFIERRDVPCTGDPCLTRYTYAIIRTGRTGGTADTIYTYGPTDDIISLVNLTTDGEFLFWQDPGGRVQRLPINAAAMPQVNLMPLEPDSLEVTQGVQRLGNSIVLIKNRRTFVRFYVKSASGAVPGVTARLEAPDLGDTPLLPVNPSGTTLTVSQFPDRDDIDQSFLFELPWSWTQQPSLYLRAIVNPNKVPLEPDYNDNVKSITVNFQNSPTLALELFRLNYTLNGVTYKPRYEEDVLKTYSFILRTYPLGGAIGESFRPRTWDVDLGEPLGELVSRSSPLCALVYDEPDDDISLCASFFMNGVLFQFRLSTWSGDLNVGLDPFAFYYGMITDEGGFFPRGQAMYFLTSVGPAGTPGTAPSYLGGWDLDGSYADWYGAHEIGHSLGRDHPVPGSDDEATENVRENCGHSRTDGGYPYGDTVTARTPIGPDSGVLEGFDVGDPAFGIEPDVLPAALWNDLMSYCSYQWISDYTYTNMYSSMSPLETALETGAALQPALVGDYLIVAGGINRSGDKGAFSMIRRVDQVTQLTPSKQNGYSLRLRGNLNALLAEQDIRTYLDDSGVLGFGHVMSFAAGTRKIELVRNADNKVLASALVSEHPPLVGNVALQGAPSPVTGVVTLTWTASDLDERGTLTYDVLYSPDDGASFQPVASGLTVKTAQIDTANLGGSSAAIFRVIASDGVNSAHADSAPFAMAFKPPQPVILMPENNLHIQYGQLVNFSGMATDSRDGTIGASGLVWKLDGELIGTGPRISIDKLPVGTNVITLYAVNSMEMIGSTTVTVIVGDDLNLPGPTLTAGPHQVGWQVPAGSTQHKTAQVSINNSGSGTLNWTASENAAWLTLSATSGSVSGGNPSILTLTADPAGLPPGRTYSAQLIITKPAIIGQPAQTIEIPVSLSVGPVRFWAGDPRATKLIFIPTVRR